MSPELLVSSSGGGGLDLSLLSRSATNFRPSWDAPRSCSDPRLQAYEEFPSSASVCLAISRPARAFHCLRPDRRDLLGSNARRHLPRVTRLGKRAQLTRL